MINPLKYNSILFSIFCLFISVFSFSQNVSLTGSILDQHKEPVRSAIIEKKGTNLATISNSNGDFTINLSSADSMLIISKKGYFEKEINVFGKENIEIELVRIEKTYINAEDFNTVAGYGQWKDVNTSNSVSHILLEKYHKSSKSLLDILELMPGITIRSESGQPGANANITIRGVESVISNQPLIIMDGIVLNSGINMPDISPETSVLSAINVADVKRIEVIKDAGSTAIFGSLGANGVIIIETEKGAKNSYKLKNQTQFGVNFPIEANNMLDPYGYFDLVNESLNASSMNPIHFPDYPTAKNWEKDILHPGLIAKNTLSLEGGGEKSQFYLSGNINYNMGVLKNSSLTSGGIRANYSTSIARWLDIAFHGVYSESYQKSPVHVENQINSNPYMYSRFYPPLSKDEIKTIPELSVPFGQTDPMELVNKTDPYNSTSFFIGGVDLAFNIADYLSFHSKINGDYSYFKKGSSVFSPEYSYLDELHQTQKSELTNWEFNNFLKFQQLKGNNNLLIILGLSELNLKVNNSINSVFIDGNTLSENWIENLEGENTRKLSTIYTKLQYAYKDYFDISASFSREKILNKDGVDLFGIFPSVSTGVWFKKSNVNEDEIFSAMKFFLGWGIPGANRFYTINTINYRSNESYLDLTKFSNKPLFNPNSRWETVEEWNLGLQTNWLNEDLIFKVTYFDRLRNNVPYLTSENIDEVYTEQWNYTGRVYNSGYKMELNYKRNFENFGVFAGFDMQINSSKVLNLGGNNVGKIGHYPDYLDAGTPLVVFKEGNAPGAFWGYINEGVVQENNDGNNISSPIAGDYKFADLDGNGIINENDKAVIGNATPDFTYSLNGGIVYGNFDFTFVLNGATGGDIYNIEKAITESSGGYNNRSIEMKNRWTELNPSQEQARVIMADPNNNNRLSSVMIESGSFFRFKRIELGYDFNFIGKNRNRAYISAYDFITFSTYSSGSPYFSGINNNNAIGFGISPFSSTIMIGLQIGI